MARSKRPKERVTITINIPAEKREILDNFDRLVRLETGKDYGGRSEWILNAMEEFYQHHWPGNPQKPLLVSLPKPTENRKVGRRNAAIIFLRFTCRFSYRQVAQVVEESYGSVRRVCKRVLKYDDFYQEFNGRGRRSLSKNFKRSLEFYRKRYRMFLKGEVETLAEAFKWRE